MILVCEKCKASFLVPASAVAAGPRKFKCGKCGHIWIIGNGPQAQIEEKKPPPPAFAAPRQAPAAFALETPPPAPPALPKARIGELAFWAGAISIGVVAVFVAMAVLLHDPIVRKWPSAHNVYLSFGVVKPQKGNDFLLRNVRSVRRFEAGATRLIVTGQIISLAAKTLPLPPLEAEAVAPDGKTIERWRIDPPQATIRSGVAVPFSSSILCPNGSVTEVNLRFVGLPNGK